MRGHLNVPASIFIDLGVIPECSASCHAAMALKNSSSSDRSHNDEFQLCLSPSYVPAVASEPQTLSQ